MTLSAKIQEFGTKCQQLQAANDAQAAEILELKAKLNIQGEVVVTTNEQNEVVVVTRQNDEGQILSVIWDKDDVEPAPHYK